MSTFKGQLCLVATFAIVFAFPSGARAVRTELSTSEAELNAKCYKKVAECPPGAFKGHSSFSGDYCQCVGKKKMMPDMPKNKGNNGQDFAANAKAFASCAAMHDMQPYWFKLSKASENTGCICEGTEGDACAATTDVTLHTTGSTGTSDLECDDKEKVCKIAAGQSCNVLHQFKGHGPGDCIDGYTCGTVSQKCVDTMTALKERNLIVKLSNSVNGDYADLASIAKDIAVAAAA